MSKKSDENRLHSGFTTMHSSTLVVPVDVAQQLKSEAGGADEIWQAVQHGRNPDGSRRSKESSDFDLDTQAPRGEPTAEADQDLASPASFAMTLNATQLSRLQGISKRFVQYPSQSCYQGGQIEAELDGPFPVLQLDLHEKAGSINQSLEQRERSTFGSGFQSSKNKRRDEHNALDLFLTACQKIPGFRAASARAKHPLKTQQCSLTPPPPPPLPIPYPGDEPPLRFDPPLLGRSEIRPSELSNCLSLGGTGAGKTHSFLLPALNAMLDYRVDGKSASILVIDPKIELLDAIKKKLNELGELDRLVVIGQSGPIRFFDDISSLSLKDRFEKANALVRIDASDDSGRWQLMSEHLVLSFLRDAQAFLEVVGVGLIESIVHIATGDKKYLRANQWVALRQMLNRGMEGSNQLRLISDIYDVLCFGVGLTRLERPYARYLSLKDADQIFYNSRGALMIADQLGSDDVAPLIDMSISRPRRQGAFVDIPALINRGAVILFQPGKKATHDLTGRALKSLFFRCAFEREDMLRPMGYFCDEAQRYLTTDEETGEHSVFDTARAYRLTACIATQSVAALQAAVGASTRDLAALDSIVVNTPTKVCFRTTDVASLQVMKRFIPSDPSGNGHVLIARPPSSLRVGECYFSLGQEWGRSRYQLRAPLTPKEVTSKPADRGTPQ